MALSEKTVLRSVTVGHGEDPFINVAEAQQVFRDGVMIAETIHRTNVMLTDFERFSKDRPELAKKYGAILGWTVAGSRAAVKARAKAAKAEEEALQARREAAGAATYRLKPAAPTAKRAAKKARK